MQSILCQKFRHHLADTGCVPDVCVVVSDFVTGCTLHSQSENTGISIKRFKNDYVLISNARRDCEAAG